MDDTTIKIAIGLRLGSSLCHPHICRHCGTEVNHLATHGLSCKHSEGRHMRQAAVNDLIYRVTSVQIRSRLELYRADGKRPNGITIVPWRNGKFLLWDATCPDTYALSYRGHATSSAGAVAVRAEEMKISKYIELSSSYCNWSDWSKVDDFPQGAGPQDLTAYRGDKCFFFSCSEVICGCAEREESCGGFGVSGPWMNFEM